MHNCEHCKFRGKYDRNPGSILGRLWRWHTAWCPGWKSYLKSLPRDKRTVMIAKYH